ncbi:MAG TPA: CRISPR system precrRNA processing endoribonuclease RAMP protein Cas6, partial [Candidatus Acidoferrales bacterium]|nr:CRISPR system precrRNA processing endoribonuclease RAMP protein Cas6 [Candidatus Acidoferrales bacterium]
SAEEAPDERLTIEFVTPLRVVYRERLATDLTFQVLLRNLLRRVAHLSYFHCGGDPSAVAFKEWIELAQGVRTARRELRWFDWERYSSRQRTAMRLGGLVGRVTFTGRLGPFRALLAAGEVTHVGKGTSFGLGRYRILGSRDA